MFAVQSFSADGPLAQRWSRGLIIPWLQVRILQGPPRCRLKRFSLLDSKPDMGRGVKQTCQWHVCSRASEASGASEDTQFCAFQNCIESCRAHQHSIRLRYPMLYFATVPYEFLGSSMAEQSAVNRFVVGSSPTRGAKLLSSSHTVSSFLFTTTRTRSMTRGEA